MSKRSLSIGTPFGTFEYSEEPIVLEQCKAIILKAKIAEKNNNNNRKWKWFHNIIKRKKTLIIHIQEDGKVIVTIL